MSAPPTTAEAVRVLREALLSFGCPTSGECQGDCPRCAAVAATENVREDVNAELLAALTKLTNEIDGSLPLIGETAIRHALGNTNLACLDQRVADARAAIARAEAAHAPDAWDEASEEERGAVVAELRRARPDHFGMADSSIRLRRGIDAAFARLGARP